VVPFSRAHGHPTPVLLRPRSVLSRPYSGAIGTGNRPGPVAGQAMVLSPMRRSSGAAVTRM
jgi:hypothetical protein